MSILPEPANMLTWNYEEKLTAFQNMAGLFAVDSVNNDQNNTYPLPYGGPVKDISYQYDGLQLNLSDYLERQRVAGLLVIKDGKIITEIYRQGTDETTHWTSWSVGKSVVSTLVGIAIRAESIYGVDDLVTDYLPELFGSAYSGVTLRHMLQMSSGVAWSEDPSTPEPNVRTFAACLARQKPGSILDIAKSLPRAYDSVMGKYYEPGTRWNYSNVEAFLIGLVLERATGHRISQYLETHIWKPFGMEQSASWMAEGPDGANSGAGDFSAILRDYGRIGQFILDGGFLPDGQPILPEGWLPEATTWGSHTYDPAYPTAQPGKYGYFWWNRPVETRLEAAPKTTPVADSTFWAAGLFGQYIAINPVARLVMVQWAVYDAPPVDDLVMETATLFNSFTLASQ